MSKGENHDRQLAYSIYVAGIDDVSDRLNRNAAGSNPQKSSKDMSLATPDGLKWVQIRPGNEMAVVYGDPSKAGELYAVRFRFADGFKVPAHWHPQDEHATVLQGTLLLGMGTNWNAAQLTTEMKQGTYIFLPKEMPHFALA
ncbi:MAG TPA: cupin domain-containing protein, partial [Candidatus Saccharimonadales bacterium]|nr:cupin domain-containing protein [Candidatus Saccharimonadales bacterium]